MPTNIDAILLKIVFNEIKFRRILADTANFIKIYLKLFQTTFNRFSGQKYVYKMEWFL